MCHNEEQRFPWLMSRFGSARHCREWAEEFGTGRDNERMDLAILRSMTGLQNERFDVVAAAGLVMTYSLCNMGGTASLHRPWDEVASSRTACRNSRAHVRARWPLVRLLPFFGHRHCEKPE